MSAAKHTPGPNPNVMRMQYVGACSLLARLSSRDMSADDLECVERALNDCADLFPGSFEVIETSRGGLSLEPVIAKATGSAA